MLLPALFLAALQSPDLDALLQQLDADDPAVRERATQEISKAGPELIPRLLALHRRSPSLEARSRAEQLLVRQPFAAFARSRPGEPIRETLKATLLDDLTQHRDIPGCVAAPAGAEPRRILLQNGSGHGQFLALDEFAPREGGGMSIRRVAFQGTTPYRPEVREEGVRVEETELDAEEGAALRELLREGTALKVRCAKPQPRGRSWSSSGSFSMRFRIELADGTDWSVAYSGYPGTSGQPGYAHGRILDQFLDHALRDRTWKASVLTPADRARVLTWAAGAYGEEAWWVREHYLDLARHLGDAAWLPYLEAAERSLEGKGDASILRQREAIRDARARIAARAATR